MAGMERDFCYIVKPRRDFFGQSGLLFTCLCTSCWGGLLLHDFGNGGQRLLSLPVLEFTNLLVIVGMPRVLPFREVEFGVVSFVLFYPSFKFMSISGHKVGSLVSDIPDLRKRINNPHH